MQNTKFSIWPVINTLYRSAGLMGVDNPSTAAGRSHRLIPAWDAPQSTYANPISNKFEAGMVGDQTTLTYDNPITYPELCINSYYILTYVFRFTNQRCPEDAGEICTGDPSAGFAVSKTVI